MHKDYDMLFNSFAGRKKDSLPFGMRLVNNKLYIYEIPTAIHEAVVTAFIGGVMSLNITLSGSVHDPFMILNSPILRFDNGAMEPDFSFHNLLRPAAVDQYPNVVVEVAYTESYDSVFSSVATYFSRPSVRVVIIVKLPHRRNQSAGRRLISQMIVCVYRAEDWHNNLHRACQAISFGVQLHPITAAQIIARSGVEEKAFIGVGRHANEVRCIGPNIDQYQLMIPGEDLWYKFPEQNRPYPLPDLRIDLWYIKRYIRDTGAIIDQ